MKLGGLNRSPTLEQLKMTKNPKLHFTGVAASMAAQYKEGFNIKTWEKNIYTYILMNNTELQRTSLLIQNTRETGKGFLSKHSVYKCDIQEFTE